MLFYSYNLMVIIIKYIVLDANGGGKESGVSGNGIVEKDYTLLISNYIYNRLNEMGIKAYLTRIDDYDLSVDERVKLIQDEFGSSSDVIVISNQLKNDNTNGVDVIYALRDEDYLAENIINFLSDRGFNINDFYQLRDELDPSLDYYPIIRDSKDNETLIIRYGNVNNINDSNDIKNRWQEMADAVVKAIVVYTGGEEVENNSFYTVKSGDSLYAIARKYNTTVDILKQINNLSSNILSVGQVLRIPSSSTNNDKNYVVVSGDSLYAIAKKYNTTVDKIKEINNLTSNNLSIGQVLKIPSINATNNYINYIVVSGDSLYAIARKYNTTVDKIKEMNNLTSNNLSIGQVIKISR